MQKFYRGIVALAILGMVSLLVVDAQPDAGKSLVVSPEWIADNLELPPDCPAEGRGLLTDSEFPRLHVFPLADDRELLELTCDVFVYQASMAYYVAPAGFAKEGRSDSAPLEPLSFKTVDLPESGKAPGMEEAAMLVGLPRVNPEAGLLELLTLSRGLGDCGRFHQWRLETETGRFVLEQARGRDCSDSTTVFPPPEQWPVLYKAGGGPAETDWVTVGSLSEPLDDVGCALTHRETVGNFPQIFKTGPDGAWMNLNGESRRLAAIEEDPEDLEAPVEYRWGEVTIRVDYGGGIQHEGGMTYPEATLILIHEGREATIPAKGGCGC